MMPSGTPASSSRAVRFGASALAIGLLAVVPLGCAHAPVNPPLARSDPAAGYRYRNGPGPSDRTGLMVALFFSGGGSRAAALSYGVLRELAATPVADGRRMLDDVTTINAVSGGSFTAAYYCLYGDRIFTDYEKRFLKHNVQDALLRRFVSPVNSVRLFSHYFGRSDLAAEYYDELLFHGATFGDLATAGAARPFLVINATNVATGTPLQFTQDQFDLIGSDLSRFPISRAVAASSAVPVLLTPITLKNYADRGPAADSLLLPMTGGADMFASQRAELTETARSYRDVAKYPYIYLMDGGLADNLSLSNLLDAVTLSGGWESVVERLRKRAITKLAIIVVNAAVDVSPDWARLGETPGIKAVVKALSNSSTNRRNKETIVMVEASLALWQAQQAAQPLRHDDQPKIYFIRVDFSASPDPAERAFFDAVPTSLSLPAGTADRLIEGGGRLLRESPAYRSLLRDLRDRPGRQRRPPASRTIALTGLLDQRLEQGPELQLGLGELPVRVRPGHDAAAGIERARAALDQRGADADEELTAAAVIDPADRSGIQPAGKRLEPADVRAGGLARRAADRRRGMQAGQHIEQAHARRQRRAHRVCAGAARWPGA